MTELRAVKIIDKNGALIDVQNPLPTNGDSVYEKDIWVEQSSIVDFSGSITDLFNNLHTVITNTTATNPKEILVHFNRTTILQSISFGANSGDFSNIEIIAVVSGGIEITIIDNSADNTKRTSQTFELPVVGLNAIKIKFHTADTITLSNLFIPKIIGTVARIQGQKDDGDFVVIGATNNDNLKVSVQEYGDTPAVDAFARLRISENFTIFDSKQLHDKQPLFWDEQVSGSATSVHDPINADVVMSVTADVNDSVIRQTKQRFNYQPGKSQLIYMTFMSEQIEGLTKRVGYFDGTGANNLTPNNGIFFETDGDISWNIAKDGVIEETAIREEWNVDKLDGTGPSQIKLETSSAQILVIDFEWLGVGRVRVGFVIDGLIYYCHYFNHANDPAFPNVYMSTPNLPLRYSIETDGANPGSMSHICSSVISEGGAQKTGILRTANTGDSYITGFSNGVSYAIVGIKLKDVYKDITIIPESFSVAIGTNDSFKWSLQINPTLAVTPTFIDLDDSAIQHSVGSTANIATANGLEIASGYASTTARQAGEDINTALRLGSTIAGAQDELYLVITPLSANMSAAAALNFRELL